jgi:hypothetical protein
LIVVLLASPLLFWGGGSGPAALSSVAAVALVGLSLAALGTRGTARKADKEDQAFIKALESHKDAKAEEEDGNFGKKDKPQQPLRLSIYVWFLSLLVGGGGLLALALAQNGAVPALRPLEPVWTVLASAGLALNPMTALLPILTDATAFGSDAIAQWFAGWGLDTELLFFLHVGIYSLMGAASILSLKTPMDLNEVMAERKPPEDEADVKAEAEAEAEAEPEATP